MNKRLRAELEGQKRQSQPLRFPLLLLTQRTAEPSQLDRWTGPRFDAWCCCTAAAQCSVAWIPRVGIRVCLSCLDGDSESACASYPYRWCLQGQCQCLCPCPYLDSVVPVPVHTRTLALPLRLSQCWRQGGGERGEGKGGTRNGDQGRGCAGGPLTEGEGARRARRVMMSSWSLSSSQLFFFLGTLSARSSPSINGATDSRRVAGIGSMYRPSSSRLCVMETSLKTDNLAPFPDKALQPVSNGPGRCRCVVY